MPVPFKLPTPRMPGPPADQIQDARYQLGRLYREIGVNAVASALNVTLASDEDRAAVARAAAEIPPLPARGTRAA